MLPISFLPFIFYAYQAMCRDSRIIPGAAASEIELARKLNEFSLKETGYSQLSTRMYLKLLRTLMLPSVLDKC